MKNKTIFNEATVFIMVSLIGIGSISAQQFVPGPSNRAVINMNMNWKFFLNDPTPPTGNPQDSAYNDANWQTVSLPSPLKIHTNYLDGSTDCNNQRTFNRQIGWYRNHFSVQDQLNKKVYIVFQTVMQVATVYVNGKLVGTHERSGYDSFHFDITGFVSFTGDNVIAVKVDNNINANSPPDDSYTTTCTNFPSGNDFILFGGINGDVSLVCTNKLAVSFSWESTYAGITVTTPTTSSVKVKVAVKNETTAAKSVTVVSTIVDAANQVVATMTSAVQAISAGGTATFGMNTAVANAKLWTPDTPNLYRLHTAVLDGSTPVDSIWTRFGIRTVTFNTTSGFYINGQKLKLIGVNRHSAWPFVGGAIPNTVHFREAQQIKSFGFNWVRLCHYPHDPDFLDAMDEVGLLALAEPPTWAHAGNATWLANMQESSRRQIRRDRNHPCIMIWNACINHSGCDATLGSIVHTEDSSRVAAQCDVACPMCWTGMDDPLAVQPVTATGGVCIEHTGHTFRTMRFMTPYLASTTYAWSNETRLLQHAGKHCGVTDQARLTAGNGGIAAWCMYDYNSFHSSGVDGGNGTNAQNHRNVVYHGLFDLYRIPKFAAQWYKSELTTGSMVFIANFWTATSPHDTLTIYSNCERVALFLNGVSKGMLVPTRGTNRNNLLHPPFIFNNIGWAAGTLVANGYIGTQIVATDTVRTPGAPARIRLETDTDTLLADGADFARVTASVLDANGTVVPTSSDPVTFTLIGPGTLIPGAVQNPIAAEAGKIITLVRSNLNVTGDVTVTATSSAITGAGGTITLHVVSARTGIRYGATPLQTRVRAPVRTMKQSCVVAGGRYQVSPELSDSKSVIMVYDLQGRLVLKTAAGGLKILDLAKTGKSEGLFIVTVNDAFR